MFIKSIRNNGERFYMVRRSDDAVLKHLTDDIPKRIINEVFARRRKMTFDDMLDEVRKQLVNSFKEDINNVCIVENTYKYIASEFAKLYCDKFFKPTF